jgi:SAM-dependent methyltransferase
MPEKHYYEQLNYTNEYLIPYFKKYVPDFKGIKVLEIGCAEAGFLAAVKGIGADVSGIEISKERVDIAHEKNEDLKIFIGDVSSENLPDNITEKFDFIVMREVIEHIPNKETTFENLYKLLNKGGYLFISFPPKYSPFAGHQQIGRTFVKMIPYLHILPKAFLYKMADFLNERPGYVDEIKLNYSTGMAIGKFEQFRRKYGYKIIQKDLFLFRPIYKGRFGLPQIKFPGIPFIKEFCTFGYEILLKKE